MYVQKVPFALKFAQFLLDNSVQALDCIYVDIVKKLYLSLFISGPESNYLEIRV